MAEIHYWNTYLKIVLCHDYNVDIQNCFMQAHCLCPYIQMFSVPKPFSSHFLSKICKGGIALRILQYITIYTLYSTLEIYCEQILLSFVGVHVATDTHKNKNLTCWIWRVLSSSFQLPEFVSISWSFASHSLFSQHLVCFAFLHQPCFPLNHKMMLLRIVIE